MVVFDNRLDNLRWATHSENGGNRKTSKNNTSGVKGVSYNKHAEKWQAFVTVTKIRINLGLFKTLEEAKQARMKGANKAFGVYTNACERM